MTVLRGLILRGFLITIASGAGFAAVGAVKAVPATVVRVAASDTEVPDTPRPLHHSHRYPSNAHIAGSIDKDVFERKGVELKLELQELRTKMASESKAHEDYSDMAVKVFDVGQGASEAWLGSNSAQKRELPTPCPL